MGIREHLTHGKILLEMFFAADEMGDVGRHLIRECPAVNLNPVPHLFRGTRKTEVSGDGYGEFLKDRFHHCDGGKRT